MTPTAVHLAWLGGRRAALLELLALLGAGLVPTLSRGSDWLGSWKAALDAGMFSATLIGPLAAGLACAAYVRLATSGVEPLLRSGPRPWWPWVRPALAVWGLAATAMLLITLTVTTAATLAGASPFYATWWVLVPALCVLAAQVAVGVVLGGLGRRGWLAPISAATTFALGVLGAVGVTPEIFRAGGLGVSYAGETFDATTLTLQAGAALGLAAGLLLLSNRQVVARSVLGRIGVAATVLVGVGCYVVLGDGVHDRYRPLAEPELVCRGEVVSVCMARETTRPLDDLVRRMERQAPALRDLGVELPARYVQPQVVPDREPSDGSLYLLDRELSPTVDDELVALSLATPASCPAYRADIPPPEASFTTRRLLARWLLVQAGLLEPDPDDADRAWLESGLADQRAWVVTTYEQLRSCDLDALRMPPGV